MPYQVNLINDNSPYELIDTAVWTVIPRVDEEIAIKNGDKNKIYIVKSIRYVYAVGGRDIQKIHMCIDSTYRDFNPIKYP